MLTTATRSSKKHSAAVALLLTLGAFAGGCDEQRAAERSEADVRRAQLAVGADNFSGNVPNVAPDEPPGVEIASRRILGDSATFGSIDGLAVAGRYLLVIDRLADPHLAVVDLESGAVINRLLGHGEGPGESTQPLSAQVVSTDPPEAWLYDFGTRRIFLLRLTAPPREAVIDEMQLVVDQSLLDPHWFGGRLVANGLFIDQRLLILDRQGRAREEISLPQPFDAEEMPHRTGRRLMNRSYLVVSPAREQMALVYQFANRIDFLRGSGAIVGSVQGPRRTELKYHLENNRFFWDDGNQVAYSAATATDRYIYALYSGNRLRQTQDEPSRVHVFEWDGDFVGEIGFDGHRLHSIAVTSDDQTLFGGLETPYPVVGEWDLASFHDRRD